MTEKNHSVLGDSGRPQADFEPNAPQEGKTVARNGTANSAAAETVEGALTMNVQAIKAGTTESSAPRRHSY